MLTLAFETESTWIYSIEASQDFIHWFPSLEPITGTGQRIEYPLLNDIDYSFYRVAAKRQ
jgi:hypothetical protein